MNSSARSLLYPVVTCLLALVAHVLADQPVSLQANAIGDDESASQLSPSAKTQGGTKILEFTIPAPRGQIVDRVGRPLAQNRVAYFPALRFPHMEDPSDAKIAAFGAAALEQLNHMAFGIKEEDAADYWVKDPKHFVQHYRNRRWLPYLLLDKYELTDRQKTTIERDLQAYGLIAHPVYLRHYPRKKFAGHIIGYVGITSPMPTRPIENGDPLFHEWEGKSGLEATLNDELTGTPGRMNIIFDKNGREIERDMLQPPIPGKTMVLTLDANMQDLAEDVLYFRSALVVMDSNNGDILAMASHPGFDPNDFIPAITQDKFSKLRDSEAKPLYGRAFQASYPPASTFKLPIAIAALKEGVIKPSDTFDCPGRMKIGRQWKHNWTSSGEGRMTMQKAIARSCNTWFYTVGMKVGSEPLVREARNFGFGRLTNIPLAERAGVLPTNAWMMEHRKHHMYSGDVANFAIGQGDVEATPLQVAQAMTGIASGTDIWRARLILQKQNHRNEVTELTKKESIGRVEMSDQLLGAIRRGMVDVVHAGHGTGKQGYCRYAQVAAKTGTAQWKVNKKMTWFAGFLPANDPQFTFAVAYEGGASGGKSAAPIAKKFFTSLYARRDPSRDMFAEVRVPGGDKIKPEADSTTSTKKRTRKRTSKKTASPPPRPTVKPRTVPAKPKKKSFIKRLFGR